MLLITLMALNSPFTGVLLIALPLIFVFLFASRSFPFSHNHSPLRTPHLQFIIWSARRAVEWRPCGWWTAKPTPALPSKINSYIRVDCYGGLNQMRRDKLMNAYCDRKSTDLYSDFFLFDGCRLCGEQTPDKNGNEESYQINCGTPLNNLMKAYCDQHSIEPDSIRFIFGCHLL